MQSLDPKRKVRHRIPRRPSQKTREIKTGQRAAERMVKSKLGGSSKNITRNFQQLSKVISRNGASKKVRDDEGGVGFLEPEPLEYIDGIPYHKNSKDDPGWLGLRRDRNPKFTNLLQRMKEIHNKKNHDYASDSNPYSNFEYAAKVANVPLHKVYLVLLGIKFARLVELLDNGKKPNNESVDDTLLDTAVYAALMASNLEGKK